MKQKSVASIKSEIYLEALANARTIRPDITDESILALLDMVARDTAYNLVEALTREGHIILSPEGISRPPNLDGIVVPAVEMAMDIFTSMLKKPKSKKA